MLFKHYLEANAGISEELFQKLSNQFIFESIPKGYCLQKAGQKTQYVYYVEKGLLRYYSVDKTGKEHIIQFAPEKGLICDRSGINSDTGSEYNIDATEASDIVSLKFEVMDNIGKVAPTFNLFNSRILNKHIYVLQQRINMLISTTVEERYLQFIDMYPNVLMRVPQWMVASYLGTTPESLSRVRKELANRNKKPSMD